MKTIQEMLQELSQCIVTVSGEFRFRTNWNGGKVPQPEPEKPDLDTFDPNVPFCIENVGDVQASVQYNTKNTNIKISKDYKTWNDYTSGTEIELNPKDRVYIKSDYVLDESATPKFNFTNANGTRLRARGNIASLLYGTGDEYITKYTTATQYCYNSMFDNCASLIQAPDLPATTLADHCYYAMFSNCTSLTQTPELPATTLADYCYRFMFNGCASLTQAPELPATTLADYCYDSMFQHCTSLTQAPELPATTLTQSCYIMMFRGCTGLTQTPALPATTLAKNCYDSMFVNCTSLTQAPELPTTILVDYCYDSMFSGCTSLNQAPTLPATTLAYGCYSYMFEGCIGLTQAPELPATTLADYCYYSMFSGCVKINYVKCLATNTSATNCTKDWLSGVSATGTFECDNKKYFTIDSQDGIPTGWSVTEINPAQPEPEKPDLDTFDPNIPFCIENVGDVPVEIGMYDVTSNIRNTCEISYNNKDWITYNLAVDPSPSDIKKIKLQNKGDRVYIKSDHYGTTMSPTPYTRIKVLNESDTTKIQARGNIASLNYARNDEYKTKYNSTENSCYSGLFMSCKSLVKAPDLVATLLSKSCYMFMFSGCTNLKYIKCLATNISASNCTNEWVRGVSSTGDFYTPASTTWSSGISGIPSGWTRHDINLDPPTPPEPDPPTPPEPDPPTPPEPEPEKPDLDTFDPNVPFCIENVGDAQANVQYNTKNTNIKISKDYKAWNDYTSGTEIELNPKDRVYIKSDYVKDTESNPRFVFNGEGARLRARGNIASLIYGTNDAYVNKYTSTEEYCYASMFKSCTSLTQAPDLPATTLTQHCYQSMFQGCTSLTQAPELPAATLNGSCYQSMFKSCTSLTQAPTLPATTLANYCYQYMFQGCTSLTQAPELPAATLTRYCYQYMFQGCTSLAQAPELPATTLADYCYQYMFYGCTGLTQAPELRATTLTRFCYNGMFNSCTKLNYVKCLATNTTMTGCVTYWLNNVSSTGDFYTPAATNWTSGVNGIPQGWTRHNIT